MKIVLVAKGAQVVIGGLRLIAVLLLACAFAGLNEYLARLLSEQSFPHDLILGTAPA